MAWNYGKPWGVGAGPPLGPAAFRGGSGAELTVLFDGQRGGNKTLNIPDQAEGEYAYRAQPYTFVLRSDLRIFKIYNGWYFVGRPTNEELRQDLRTIMESRSDYHYEAYKTPEVQQIRIPQQEWAEGATTVGSK